ncbi:SDR family oxidoreductase [Nocardia sp. NPDC050717]|uniref:SDR family oxidoreductase n=1 Tax=Nocardia sp. NPDC050717 TaxID=3157221 RepID=UPI0034103B18
MSTNRESTFLITGASGVIGGALVELLAGHRIYALGHSKTGAARAGVTWLSGDIRQPDLGLGEDYARIADEVDRVIHVAAMVDFNRDEETIRSINVNGTRNVLRFCEVAGAGIVHTSSSFVARAESAKVVTGTGCAGGRDDYLRSKIDGEAAVRTSGIDYVIARPSLLMGDSATGKIVRHQGLHTFLGAYVKGALPFVPFSDTAQVDFLAQDMVAAALARLATAELDGSEYWLTAGDNAVATGEIVALCGELYGAAGIALTTPRYFQIEAVQRLILPALGDVLDAKARNKFDNLLAMASLFTDAPFESSLGSGPFVGIEPTAETARDLLTRTVRAYWLPETVAA